MKCQYWKWAPSDLTRKWSPVLKKTNDCYWWRKSMKLIWNEWRWLKMTSGVNGSSQWIIDIENIDINEIPIPSQENDSNIQYNPIFIKTNQWHWNGENCWWNDWRKSVMMKRDSASDPKKLLSRSNDPVNNLLILLLILLQMTDSIQYWRGKYW